MLSLAVISLPITQKFMMLNMVPQSAPKNVWNLLIANSFKIFLLEVNLISGIRANGSYKH